VGSGGACAWIQPIHEQGTQEHFPAGIAEDAEEIKGACRQINQVQLSLQEVPEANKSRFRKSESRCLSPVFRTIPSGIFKDCDDAS
jgi:hypothetical protein